MKNIVLFLLLFSGIAKGQFVNIPDANFKSRLISLGIDSNTDGEIQFEEADAATTLNLFNASISDLTGIEAFVNLTGLNCSTNNLTSLPISALNQLTNLNCMANQITTLNLSSLTQLRDLFCSNNPLGTLDVQNMTNLTTLTCANNQLTSLNVSGCTALDILHADLNPIATLDISSSSVREFSAEQCPNLTHIIIKNGVISGHENVFPPVLSFSGSDALRFVCTDEGEEVFVFEVLSGDVLNNISVSTYCSFTPGGDYNTITGNTTFDLSNDGCSNDAPSPYIKMAINDGTNTGSTFSNNNGNYSFFTGSGIFNVAPDLENPTWFNLSPLNASVSFPIIDNSVQTRDFCISTVGNHPDLEVIFAPTSPAQPGFEASYKIVYRNKGNQVQSGTVTFSFDNVLFTYLNANPTFNLLQPGLFTWDYSNLKPFETRTINLTLLLHNNLGLNAGDTLEFTATVNPMPSDETPLDNVSTHVQTVVESGAANQTICIEGHTISQEQATRYLHYNINFENIGTAEALNVVVKDTIDTAKFKLNSLRLLYSSHPVETKITDNIVEFIFKNIQLPPRNGGPIGGHGNVLFKIEPESNLAIGTEIIQEAQIYFDYNIPINTNQERTTVALMGRENFTDANVWMAPNPAKDYLDISAKNKINSLELYDAQGRILETHTLSKFSTRFNFTKHPQGVYFLKTVTEKGSSVQKIVKE
ncbi:T9SS type A sorting domain-containing protein [Flavobacterium sp. CYK-4]|uniref:DUF7619 domain-containing protein n=1 Tax=Flavobacterium lotistagni TaxID=2709660 RepID=UPI00140A98E8|nr:T9SS type A sorting domain-containing protein [Flavobacterium lotistagni]NHM06257.1 T9SS type A sorting domain-containing protein [Flavobacterium lotistagni]